MPVVRAIPRPLRVHALAGCASEGVAIKPDGTRDLPEMRPIRACSCATARRCTTRAATISPCGSTGHRVLVMGGGPKSIEIYDADRRPVDPLGRSARRVSRGSRRRRSTTTTSGCCSLRSSRCGIGSRPRSSCRSRRSRSPRAPRRSHAAVGEDRGHRRAGLWASRQDVPDVAVYDPTRDLWSAHPPLHHARSFASVSSAATSMGDTILVRGGGELAERWDPRLDAWVELLDDPRNRTIFIPAAPPSIWAMAAPSSPAASKAAAARASPAGAHDPRRSMSRAHIRTSHLMQ